MRLAVLTTHPIQYQAPIFRGLASQPDCDVKVFFGCTQGVTAVEDPAFKVTFTWDCDPLAGYIHEFLSDGPISSICGVAGLPVAFRAAKRITAFRPDVVLVFAYSPLLLAVSSILLKITGCELILRAETTDVALERTAFKTAVRRLLLNLYYRMFTHFFPIGTYSVDHYAAMGVTDDKMTIAPYAIDVDFYQQHVEKWSPQRESLRKAAGIGSDDHVFIYCGKMYWPKKPLLLPQAFSLLGEEKSRIWLLAVGDGEMREEFENLSREQLGGRSLFTGFKNQSELGRFYAMADTLILPSKSGETWGLVVNEALQFGLRVIVSDKVGCAYDLIDSMDRGMVFHSGSASDLAECIKKMMESPAKSSCAQKELPHPNNFVQAVIERL